MMTPEMLSRPDAGAPDWWREVARQGAPLVAMDEEGRYWVTFLWRDPQGSEETSAFRKVWLNINGLTDHHQGGLPQSLTRLPGTDVWYRRVLLSATWRGSYCFIPDTNDAAISGESGRFPSLMAGREWWRGLLAGAVHDPLNPSRPWTGGRGHASSALHMPLAPSQSAWRGVDEAGELPSVPAPPALMRQHRWHSGRLRNSRDIWVLTTGQEQPRQRPLAIVLDGRFWCSQMPVAMPLGDLTRQERLPEAVYVLIDSIDTGQRSRELTCNPEFWTAVREELLPQLAAWAPYNADPATTVVAGQSFGGLSAMYAALHWPDVFGQALSLSGSFWWPHRVSGRHSDGRNPEGWLLEQLEGGLGAGHALNLYIEAGIHERLIDQVNERLVALLRQSGHRIVYRRVDGGHDALCWRGGLLDGLMALWTGTVTEGAHCYPRR